MSHIYMLPKKKKYSISTAERKLPSQIREEGEGKWKGEYEKVFLLSLG